MTRQNYKTQSQKILTKLFELDRKSQYEALTMDEKLTYEKLMKEYDATLREFLIKGTDAFKKNCK